MNESLLKISLCLFIFLRVFVLYVIHQSIIYEGEILLCRNELRC